jgi:hypothetical protein
MDPPGVAFTAEENDFSDLTMASAARNRVP